MRQFNIREAKAQPSNLVEITIAGEEVVIAKKSIPVARLVPLGRRCAQREKGLLEARIKTNPGFDQLIPDDMISLFEGGGQP